MELSVLMITKNAASMLEMSLASVKDIAGEIIVVDDCSDDGTKEIARNYGAHVYEHHQVTFGGQRRYGLEKCKFPWVLMLDADELLTAAARNEIRNAIQSNHADGYRLPFLNHFLGHELHYGGETYSKLILFRKDKTRIVSEQIHELAEVDGKVATLEHPVLHYSYRSLGQTYAKFAAYARNEAIRKKQRGEASNLWKLAAYPVHMFAARYIEDKGYRDHISRILLDFGFAYMEFLTYFFMLFSQKKDKKA